MVNKDVKLNEFFKDGSQKNRLGITLIELMITLSVIVLILIVATPSFNTLLSNGRMSANTDALVNGLNYARSTAVTQNNNVTVCPLGTINSTSCGTTWSNGWIVVNPTTNTLLKSQQTSTNDPILTSTAASVIFDSQGLATTASQFKFCDNRGGTFARSVQVLATGLVQSGPTAGQAVWDNSSLTCP